MVNEEFRQIKAIIDILMTKVRRSRQLIKIYVFPYDIYRLDTIDIYFNTQSINTQSITIKDKFRREIISFDRYHCSCYDRLQREKWNMFYSFITALNNEFDRRDQRTKNYKRLVQTEIQKEKVARQQKAKIARQQYSEIAKQKMLSDALDKLHGL